MPLTSAPAGRWGGREDRPRDENHEKKDHKAAREPLHPRRPHVFLKVSTGCCGQKRATFSSGLSPQEWDAETGGRHSASRGRWRCVCVCRLQESGWMLSGVAGRLLWADGSQDWCSSRDWTRRCSRHTSIREGGNRQRRTHPPTIILPLLSFPPVSTPPPTPPFILERGESLPHS